jgi:hypothetical protein
MEKRQEAAVRRILHTQHGGGGTGVQFHKKNMSTTTRRIHVLFWGVAWGVLFRGYYMLGRVVPSLSKQV